MCELKPCPFCGSDNVQVRDYTDLIQSGAFPLATIPYSWSVNCDNCGCIKEFYVSEDEAVKAWNMRVNDG